MIKLLPKDVRNTIGEYIQYDELIEKSQYLDCEILIDPKFSLEDTNYYYEYDSLGIDSFNRYYDINILNNPIYKLIKNYPNCDYIEIIPCLNNDEHCDQYCFYNLYRILSKYFKVRYLNLGHSIIILDALYDIIYGIESSFKNDNNSIWFTLEILDLSKCIYGVCDDSKYRPPNEEENKKLYDAYSILMDKYVSFKYDQEYREKYVNSNIQNIYPKFKKLITSTIK